jgi:hypothetical protein
VNLSPAQIRILERLRADHFEIVAFPMYANHIGVRKGSYAALLAPSAATGTFTIFGTPSYLIAGNLTVKVERSHRQYFVWKKDQLEVTPERERELAAFARSLTSILESP